MIEKKERTRREGVCVCRWRDRASGGELGHRNSRAWGPRSLACEASP